MTNYERLKRLLCGGPTAYTPSGVAQWRKAGRYKTVPKEGSFVYFYSSSLGRVSHVGIVRRVSYKNGMYFMDTIEGNTAAGKNDTAWRDGGKCMTHTYEFLPSQVGGSNRINGFGYPVFEAETCSKEQLIEEAAHWLGYLEHRTPDRLEEFAANVGDSNCTIFGRWYGQTVGDTNTYTCAQWCSMFCCYCAYQAVVKAHEAATGWVQSENGWIYRKPYGDICRDEWLNYGGRWYVFSGSGKMITGWFKTREGWYYLADDGAMCSSQWVCDEATGKSYYVTASGLMATNCYVRSEKLYAPARYIYYWVDGDGAWDPKKDTEAPDLKEHCVAA